MSRRSGSLSVSLADRVRSIFASRGLSLADVCRVSREIAPSERFRDIPHNFYSLLRSRRFSPSLYQLFALSAISGFRLVDWLAVFGFSLDDVPRFQAAFPTLRTVELDARIYDSRHAAPWFTELRIPDFAAPLTPLTSWLGLTTRRTVHPVQMHASSSYRFVKIGAQDSYAFPDLIP